MHLSIAALAACVAAVHAFYGTSPYVMFSSSPFPESMQAPSRARIQSRQEVLSTTKEFLRSCPSQTYYIVGQIGITTEDLSSHAPMLKAALQDKSVQSSYVVSEAVDMSQDDSLALLDVLTSKCGAKVVKDLGTQAGVRRDGDILVAYAQSMSGVAAHERAAALERSDKSLGENVLQGLPKGDDYTVIYLSTPVWDTVEEEEGTYWSQFPDPFHMDLKRNLKIRANDHVKDTDRRPLFEKYQFLTPGLFMGIVVTLLLLAILSVGINAVSSLQVSYGAFEKEMGPAAQKKQ